MPEQLAFDFVDSHPETRPTTVYLLHGVGSSPRELRTALRARYERQEGFRVHEVTIDGIRGVASRGVIGAGGKPPWAEDVARLVGEPIDLTNHMAAAVILLPVDGRVFAVSFGFGHLLLDGACITSSFGLDYALRAVDPHSVSELTHTRMDSRVYTDRSSTARDQHVRDFDLDEYGEICTRLVGRAAGTGLSTELNPRRKNKRPRVTGGDSLNVPLALDETHLVADLRAISAQLGEEPDPGFEAISDVRGLTGTDPRVTVLDRELSEALHSSSMARRIAFAVPSPLLNTVGEGSAVRVSLGRGRQPFLTDDVTPETFRDLLDRQPVDSRLEALKKARLQLMSDADGGVPVGPTTDALRWLSAEIALEGSHFLRHGNKWYEIGANHLEYVDAELRRLFEASREHALPAWPTRAEAATLGLTDADERGYNELAAQKLGWACLDRKTIKCRLHPSGFEAADLVTPDGTLVHVKRAGGSGPLSHLFVQGRVSADALHTEADANRVFVSRATESFPAFPQGPFKPRRVLFAIAMKTGADLTPDSLFTLSRISLLDVARRLKSMGIEVHVQGIDYHARGAQDRTEKRARRARGAGAAA